MSRKEHKFWAYNSFKKQLTVNGYIKEQFQSIPYHPSDVISLIFQYYHTFILELQYFSYNEEQSVNNNDIITAKPNISDIWVRPSTAAQWAIRSTSSINKLPLQYEFTIKCIDNMSNNNVFIGIAPFNQASYSSNNACRYYRDVNGNFKCNVLSRYERFNGSRQSAYFIQNAFNSYIFSKEISWWNESVFQRYSTFKMQCLKRISAPKTFKKDDIISLILNCKEWKLSFFINNIFINSIQVAKDVIYSPVILFKDCENTARCKIISMRCSLIKDECNSNRKTFDKCDVNEYIFICRKAHRGAWLPFKYVLRTTESECMHSEATGIERKMQSENAIFASLYQGKKILFHELDSLNKLIVAMKSDAYNFHLWLIIEIYIYFCQEYKALLLSLINEAVSEKDDEFDGEIEKISGIITDFVFENFDDGYEEYNKNNGMLRNLMCFKWDKWVKNDLHATRCNNSFEHLVNKIVLHQSRMDITELNENNLPTTGIYSGINMHFSDYRDGWSSYDPYEFYFDYDYYYNRDDCWPQWYHFKDYKDKNNFYESYIVQRKCKNNHRKKKRKEKKKIKCMKKENKKQKRNELNAYVKKYIHW